MIANFFITGPDYSKLLTLMVYLLMSVFGDLDVVAIDRRLPASQSAVCWKKNQGAVWPDLEKFRHFCKTLQVFGKFLKYYFLFDKMLSLSWQIWYFIGLIFIAANGQIFKNNLTIWSHCFNVVEST